MYYQKMLHLSPSGPAPERARQDRGASQEEKLPRQLLQTHRVQCPAHQTGLRCVQALR